jgi:transcription elongation GreA/GreB family factor
MQKILMRRKGELEQELVRARGTDFASPKTDAVSIGTRVTVTDLNNPHTEHFTILGAWDGDPDQNILSYLTPLGKALLNHKLGDEVEFDMDGAHKRYRIDAITPVQAAEPAPAPSLVTS